MVNKALFSSNTGEWETPQEEYDELNEQYRFNLDPCATDENAKCENYFTKEQDGLSQDWKVVDYNPEYKSPYRHIKGRVFCNPPYGRGTIAKWVKKAREEVENGNAELVVMLLPARTDTKWFHEDVLDAPCLSAIYFYKGRMKFGGAKNSAPFPSILAVYTKEEE